MEKQVIVNAGYLIASICFIMSLKLMNSPKTARKGNLLATFGMALAIFVTFLNPRMHSFTWVVIGLAVGTVIGWISAKRVQMTAMPQLVAIFNGVGGGAVALVALIEYRSGIASGTHLAVVPLITAVLSCLIGSISLSGNIMAFAKLQGLMTTRPVVYPFQRPINLLILMSSAVLAVWLIGFVESVPLFFILLLVGMLLGILFVLPIGGADMPVVIALLNSFTGVAAGLAGFVLHNTALLIGGALVGASGLILTLLMCAAMNRSLENVIFGALGTDAGGAASFDDTQKTLRSYTPEDAAIIFSNASSVIIVPGYGMAVAQAQHVIKELMHKLQDRNIDVKFAIHPVAGRMPGHMNVLLAEADVPYDLMFDLDEINASFNETDVVLVVGANDVVNPAARHDKTSPIYGMPILDVDKARTVIVIKRSMGKGFAGIDNELFFNDNTIMVFGDAKAVITKLVSIIDDY